MLFGLAFVESGLYSHGTVMRDVDVSHIDDQSNALKPNSLNFHAGPETRLREACYKNCCQCVQNNILLAA